jgi:hypothetical protein
MTSTRYQHLAPALIVLFVAVLVAWLSFTQEPAGAFLFPRLISVVFVLLAIWNFARAGLGLTRVGSGLSGETLRHTFPGLVLMLVYAFFMARGLGFYVSTALTFLVICTLYDPAPLKDAKAWLKRVAVTLVFCAVMYALFAMLLKVQTPRGLLF